MFVAAIPLQLKFLLIMTQTALKTPTPTKFFVITKTMIIVISDSQDLRNFIFALHFV